MIQRSVAVESRRVPLPKLRRDTPYSFLFSLAPGDLKPDSRVDVRLRQGEITLLHKTLHAGDPDFYSIFHLISSAAPELRIQARHATGNFHLRINAWPRGAPVKQEPNNRWEDANPIQLGATIFASGDETPYIPSAGAARSN